MSNKQLFPDQQFEQWSACQTTSTFERHLTWALEVVFTFHIVVCRTACLMTEGLFEFALLTGQASFRFFLPLLRLSTCYDVNRINKEFFLYINRTTKIG